MLPAFATIDDLDARHPGGITDVDAPRAQAAIDDASALIRAEAGKTWVTDGALDADIPDIITTICCRAALRSVVNPSGVQQETAGPFNVSYANSSSDVYLTTKERAMVKRAAGGGVFSIDTAPSCTEVHAEVCALNFGADYCSCGADLAGFPLYELDI
jgi:hypothetical protein